MDIRLAIFCAFNVSTWKYLTQKKSLIQKLIKAKEPHRICHFLFKRSIRDYINLVQNLNS